MSESNQHYKIHKPEPLDLIQRYNLSFIEGNVVKYVMRSPFKGDSTGDLNKAMEYAQLLQDIGFYRQFEASELNEYTELTELEKEIVCDVIRADIIHIVQKLQRAIAMSQMHKALSKIGYNQKKEHKSFNPDWLPPHPLVTLLDVVDQDPYDFLEKICSHEYQEEELELFLTVKNMIDGDDDFISILPKIAGGSEEFWKNRYHDYWEKRKQSVTK